MNEGAVDGHHDVECPECNSNNWNVRVEHSYGGPAVNLDCRGPVGGDCYWSIRISVGQEMVLY